MARKILYRIMSERSAEGGCERCMLRQVYGPMAPVKGCILSVPESSTPWLKRSPTPVIVSGIYLPSLSAVCALFAAGLD